MYYSDKDQMFLKLIRIRLLTNSLNDKLPSTIITF